VLSFGKSSVDKTFSQKFGELAALTVEAHQTRDNPWSDGACRCDPASRKAALPVAITVEIDRQILGRTVADCPQTIEIHVPRGSGRGDSGSLHLNDSRTRLFRELLLLTGTDGHAIDRKNANRRRIRLRLAGRPYVAILGDHLGSVNQRAEAQ
jgi:hypothetical protein